MFIVFHCGFLTQPNESRALPAPKNLSWLFPSQMMNSYVHECLMIQLDIFRQRMKHSTSNYCYFAQNNVARLKNFIMTHPPSKNEQLNLNGKITSHIECQTFDICHWMANGESPANFTEPFNSRCEISVYQLHTVALENAAIHCSPVQTGYSFLWQRGFYTKLWNLYVTHGPLWIHKAYWQYNYKLKFMYWYFVVLGTKSI